MNSLEDFLALPNVDEIEEEVFVSKRLGKFKVKAMSSDEFGEYQKRARGKVDKKGVDIDVAKFNLLIVAGQTVEPNFNNAELLKKAGCATATDLIKKKLLAGEIAELAQQITKLSGFDSDINEDIEEAKN
jgi:hypothetical protein